MGTPSGDYWLGAALTDSRVFPQLCPVWPLSPKALYLLLQHIPCWSELDLLRVSFILESCFQRVLSDGSPMLTCNSWPNAGEASVPLGLPCCQMLYFLPGKCHPPRPPPPPTHTGQGKLKHLTQYHFFGCFSFFLFFETGSH
jgi:hypothetical protein